MHRIVLPDLVRLLARVGARPIGDPALPVALAEWDLERDAGGRDGRLRGEADATASVALHVFNGTGDRDSGGVLGTRRRRSGARAAGDHRPLVLKHDGQAWLRIALDAGADALVRAGGAGGSCVSVHAGAGAEARLLSYRRHDPGAACAEAIVGDLARFADARSLRDVRALGVGDACAFHAGGTLSTSLSLSWAALLSATGSALADASGPHAPVFLVEMPADASASLALAISDGFSVAFARTQADGDAAFRVAVRRRHGDVRSLDASLAIEAGFADPEAVARAIAGVLASLLDVPADALHAIRKATSWQALPARHRPYAKALSERFGIADSAPLQALRERLEALDARLAGRIEAVARSRASAVLEAEYRRMAEDAVLLEADLSEAALARLHAALSTLDVDAVMADRGPGVAAVSLLHDRTLERLHGWSIAVSLGSWFELESRQQRRERCLVRHRVDADGDRTRREFSAATRYTARVNGWSTAYGATFESVDDGSGAGSVCALALWWEEGRLRADANGLARIVDDAVLWGVVAADAALSLQARLQDALAGVGRCRPRFEWWLDGEAASAALSRLAGATPEDWAVHAARALPRNARVAERATCDARGATYGRVFAKLGDASGARLQRAIAAGLQGADGRLVARERRGVAPWTAWRVLRQSGLAARGPGRAWRTWGEAASRLSTAATNDAFGGAFADLRPVFEQPFTVRTVASLLADAVAGAHAARLTLSFERDGMPRTLLGGA